MQIKTIEPIAVSLPMIKPVIMAGEEVRARRQRAGAHRPPTTHRRLGRSRVGADHDRRDAREHGLRRSIIMASALHGRDAADIAGAHARRWTAACTATTAPRPRSKSRCTISPAAPAGKPVHALLGDKKRSRMPLLGVIGGGDFEGDLRDAESKKSRRLHRLQDQGRHRHARERRRAHARDLQGAGRRHAHLRRRQPGLTASSRRHLRARGERLGPRFLRAAGRGRRLSTAWRRSRPQPTSRSAPTKAFIRSTTSAVITSARRRAASASRRSSSAASAP